MERSRAKDWLIGAGGTVLVLVVAAAVLWWTVSVPGDRGEAGRGVSPPAGDQRAPSRRSPPGLPEDRVWLSDLALDAGTVVAAGSTLRDVRAVGQDVVTTRGGLVAAQVTVDATVPFAVVAHELGDGTVVHAAGGGQVTVVRTVEALGRELRVVATGTVQVDAGRVLVEPRSVDVGGPEFLSDATTAVVRRFVTIEHDVKGLPPGLVLRHVTVRDDGFRVRLRGEDVRLVQ